MSEDNQQYLEISYQKKRRQTTNTGAAPGRVCPSLEAVTQGGGANVFLPAPELSPETARTGQGAAAPRQEENRLASPPLYLLSGPGA